MLQLRGLTAIPVHDIVGKILFQGSTMNPALENLKLRGFFQQCTDTEGLSRLMDEGPAAFYAGWGP
jgi:hypothetical protein